MGYAAPPGLKFILVWDDANMPRRTALETAAAKTVWGGRTGKRVFEFYQIMKNWITIVEDGDSIVTAHFPITRVRLVIEVKDKINIRLEKGSIKIKGVGVEKLVPKLLAGDLPVLRIGVAGIKSVKFDRELGR